MKKIKKAVIPVAGYGTRFLPVTKALPKEMLPIVDKPVIQYIVEELVDAGIEQIVLVTSWHKRAIEDHFDRHFELEQKLSAAKKFEQLEKIKKISEMAEFIYVRQKEQRGNGDAILTAEHAIGDEPFIVLWGDDIMPAVPSRTKQLLTAFEKHCGNILGAIRTSNPEDTSKYAFAKGEQIEDSTILVSDLVEKPGVNNCPSDLAIVSGCILLPSIFGALRSVNKNEREELVYVDGINKLREDGIKSYAVEIKNGRYSDCGNVSGYLKTNIEEALQRPDLKNEITKFIKELSQKL